MLGMFLCCCSSTAAQGLLWVHPTAQIMTCLRRCKECKPNRSTTKQVRVLHDAHPWGVGIAALCSQPRELCAASMKFT